VHIINHDHCLQGNTHFHKKLPADCESSIILVGGADYLHKHFACFVRMKQSNVVEGLSEVQVLIRTYP
jgi:hypothetical protein